MSGDLYERPKLVGVGGGWVQASRGAACLQSEDDPTPKNSPAQQVSAPQTRHLLISREWLRGKGGALLSVTRRPGHLNDGSGKRHLRFLRT